MIEIKNKSKLGYKYTDEYIKDNVENLGFRLNHIDKSNEIPLVYVECDKGHKRTTKANDMRGLKCLYCEGRRHDIDSINKELGKEGYHLLQKPDEVLDGYGNKFVKASNRLRVGCSRNHESKISMTEYRRGRRCSICQGTYRYSGYSRSEEIISGVLNYNDIYHERQKPMSEQFDNRLLDFYIPQLNLIIEYDGAHHTYGRSTDSEVDLERQQESDALRDRYANKIDFRLVRIPHNQEGKRLVYYLKEILDRYKVDIDPQDPYYDELVKDVLDYSSKEFGWLPYETIKYHADVYSTNSLTDSSFITGSSQTVISKHFRWIYGMTKEEYKNRRG